MRLVATIILSALALIMQGQPPLKKTLSYLGEEVPGVTPKIFAAGVVSIPGQYEFGSVFSKDGKEFYYAVVDSNDVAEIRFMKYQDNQWTKPAILVTDKRYSHNDPFLSPDEKRLFFISDRPLNGNGPRKDYDIWYVERNGAGWSAPLNAGTAINSPKNEYYISFTQKGTMFFSSNVNAAADKGNDYDIYSSASIDGKFQERQRLNDSINSTGYEADVCVASDGTCIIFCADRQGGLGKGDLYISFRQQDGTWTKSKNMGPMINTTGHEFCPFITRDGKYLFYTSNKDIYWVDTQILNQLR